MNRLERTRIDGAVTRQDTLVAVLRRYPRGLGTPDLAARLGRR